MCGKRKLLTPLCDGSCNKTISCISPATDQDTEQELSRTMLAMNILGAAATIFTTKADLRAGVQAYDANPTAAIATHGPIAGWDVSAITDMTELFFKLGNFNADISSCDTSRVTSMRWMFNHAAAFNQPLSFDTSSVTNMTYMFDGA